MEKHLVQDWMSASPIIVSPDTTIMEAHKLMIDQRVRRLPVVKNKKLVGIVTLGDLRGAEPSEATSLSVWEVNYLLSKLTVEEIMTREVVTVSPEMTIREAASLMLEHRIAGLPVLAGDNLVGIITESDIFRMIVDAWSEEKAVP